MAARFGERRSQASNQFKQKQQRASESDSLIRFTFRDVSSSGSSAPCLQAFRSEPQFDLERPIRRVWMAFRARPKNIFLAIAFVSTASIGADAIAVSNQCPGAYSESASPSRIRGWLRSVRTAFAGARTQSARLSGGVSEPSQALEIERAIASGRFRTRVQRQTRSGSMSGGGVSIGHNWTTEYSIPDVYEPLAAFGFVRWAPPPSEEPEIRDFYRMTVPFGAKRLIMDVRVHYSVEQSSGDAVYMPSELPAFMGRDGRFRARGPVSMRYGTLRTVVSPRALEVTFRTDETWGIYQTWAPDYPLDHPAYALDPDRHSYDALTARKNLALDLTRATAKTVRRDGFDALYTFNDHLVPDIDLPAMRGGLSLVDTDPIRVRIDDQGYCFLFIRNFVYAMRLSDAEYARVRTSSPAFRRFDSRESRYPVAGQPYELER